MDVGITFQYLLKFFAFHCIATGAKGIDFIKPVKNISSPEGQDVVIRCDIPFKLGGQKSWTYETSVLFANTDKLLNEPRLSLLADSPSEYSMKLENLKVEDEGQYTCTIYRNGTRSSTMYLTVTVPPRIVEVSDDLSVDEEEEVTLRCLADGKPKPEITWRRLIPSADGVRARSGSLPLGQVTRSSSGKYECKADNNVLYPAKETIQLTVNYPPEIESSFMSAVIREVRGKSIFVECIASAVPAPNFKWYQGSKEITSKTSERHFRVIQGLNTRNGIASKLHISKVRTSDYGNFTCLAQNRLGSSNYTITLSEKFAPPSRPNPRKYFEIFKSIVQDGGRGSSPSLKHEKGRMLSLLTTLILPCLTILFENFN
ncbi:unnamed protein product [Clavelina lepadiformis]|uniref:Ig-like domain-containing protein n=1 Tax=Clavelina lepadiformis TaxID=159417 RepID=A0ABP0FFL6_CLALP